MKAVILAAGKSLRLLPLTKETNKVILPIGETSTLENLLTLLYDEGIKPVVVTGFDHEKVSKIVRKYNGSIIFNKHFKESTFYPNSLAYAWEIFRDNETLFFLGDAFIDRKTFETILNTQPNSCLVKEKHHSRFFVKGKNNIVEEFIHDHYDTIFNDKNIVGRFIHICHLKKGTFLHQLLKESINTKSVENETHHMLWNKIVEVEGMTYYLNKGFYHNFDTFKDLKTITNYLRTKNEAS